jgi:2-methylfumaryl-CoA hydratase
VMVRKRDFSAPAPEAVVPKLPDRVDPAKLGGALPKLNVSAYNNDHAGSRYRWGDYEVGEKIDHVDGMTLEEAEHQIATRLYQNTAKVHFNQHTESKGRFGKRIVYGGVVISLARALSYNGLNNAFHFAAINAGRHVSPCFAGDTVYAWSEILEKAEIPGRTDVGALRIRLVAVKNQDCATFPLKKSASEYSENVLLELDAWVVLPR